MISIGGGKARISPVKETAIGEYYALWRRSSDTDNLFLPLALLEAKILLPLAVDMRSRNPCLFLLLR